MERWKKIALIAGFVILFLFFAYLLYALFFRPIIAPPAPVVPAPTNVPSLPPPSGARPPLNIPVNTSVRPETVAPEGISAALPEGVSATAKGGATAVLDLTATRAYEPTLDADGTNILYYDKDLGKFYRLFPDGRTALLSEKNFVDVDTITWSPDTTKTVLEYPDGSNVLFDFATNKQVTLPKHWEDFDFSPEGGQIEAKSIGVDIDNRWLVIANEDGSNPRAVQELSNEADRLITDWSPNRQMIAMYANPDGGDRQKLYFVGQNNENFRLLVLPGFGFESRWSPSGSQLLLSVYNQNSQYKPELWISDIAPDTSGSARRSLNVATWAEKCAFTDEDTAYCAVPRTLEAGSGIFGDEFKAQTQDDFYKINLKTGGKSLVAQPYGSNYAVEQLLISKDGTYLYFTDYASGKIHSIRLKE